MGIKRRTVIAGGGAAILAAGAAKADETAIPANPLAAAISPAGDTITVTRICAENGKTLIAEAALPADVSPYPLFKQFLTHKASATALYAAPPRHRISGTPAPAKDLVLIAAGRTSLSANGKTKDCAAGSFILIEPGSAHDEQAGPNGFTAIRIRLAE